MMRALVMVLFMPLISHAHIAESVACIWSHAPDGRVEKYLLFRMESSAALLSWTKSQSIKIEEAVLAKDLDCMPAKSDFRIVNCVRKSAEGNVRLSDASLTIIKHSYLAAGPVRTEKNELTDSLTENYRLYFRDDRVPKKELDKNFPLSQCRSIEPSELEWAKALLNKNP